MGEVLTGRLREAEGKLAGRKETACFFEAVSPPGKELFSLEMAGEGLKRVKSPGKRPAAMSGKLLRRYGRCSKEAAAAGALAVRDRAGSGWGVYVTAPALLPVPLSGDPLEDGGTDIAAIFVAVTDGRKAAIQQLEAPGDLSDPEARAAAAESAALQAVSLLLGLLEGEPSAEALRFSVSGLRRYVRPFWESLLRALFPWKGDGMGLIVLKSALIAAVLLLAVAAGLYVSDAAGTRTADLYQQNRTILMAPGYTGPESDR